MRTGFIKRTILTIGLIVLSTVVVMAAATFGPNTSTEPTWLDPGYQWMVEVDQISNPDKVVCLEYSIQPAGISGSRLCSCDDTIDPGDNCLDGTGHWTCTLPGNYPDSTITWSTGTWSAGGGNSCGDKKTQAAGGTIPTGPNAVTLNHFNASVDSPITSAGVIAGLAVLTLAGFGVHKLRKH